MCATREIPQTLITALSHAKEKGWKEKRRGRPDYRGMPAATSEGEGTKKKKGETGRAGTG